MDDVFGRLNAWLDGVYKADGMTNAPKGYTPIPRSRMGGYHKLIGGVWHTWYPHRVAKKDPAAAKEDSSKPAKPTAPGSDGVRTSVRRSPSADFTAEVTRGGATESAEPYKHGVDISEHKLSVKGQEAERAKWVADKLKAAQDRKKAGLTDDLCAQEPALCAGNLGIPRSSMPQILTMPVAAAAVRDPGVTSATQAAGGDPNDGTPPIRSFIESLRGDGVKVTQEQIPAGKLKATQREIKAEKSFKFANDYYQGTMDLSHGDDIIVSSDNHILDGHHRWAALQIVDPEGTMPMSCFRIDMPIKELLKRSFEEPGVFRMDLNGNVVPETEPVDLGDGPFVAKRRPSKAMKDKGDAYDKGSKIEASTKAALDRIAGGNFRPHAKEPCGCGGHKP